MKKCLLSSCLDADLGRKASTAWVLIELLALWCPESYRMLTTQAFHACSTLRCAAQPGWKRVMTDAEQ